MATESGGTTAVWFGLGNFFNSFGFIGKMLLAILCIFFLMGDDEQHHWLVDFVSFRSETIREQLIFGAIIATLLGIYVIDRVREKRSQEKTKEKIEQLNKQLTLPAPKSDGLDLNEDRPEPQRGELPPKDNQSNL